MANKFCETCGSAITEGIKFCPGCGKATAGYQNPPQINTQPIINTPAQSYNAPNQNTVPPNQYQQTQYQPTPIPQPQFYQQMPNNAPMTVGQYIGVMFLSLLLVLMREI